ncbi:MAG: ribonuclease [Erysipelotrichales bacterium]|nr:ribonuclease [Erysipelotrichales bacterium]
MKKLLKFLLPISLILLIIGCSKPSTPTVESGISEDGWYSSKEEVSLYIYTYGELPDNYITKQEARELGWDSEKGNLWEVAEGMSIGGDKFGNREGLLPKEKGRQYYECDIDYEGGYRNAKRIVYSNDGLIYYTEDHYESFEEIIYEED